MMQELDLSKTGIKEQVINEIILLAEKYRKEKIESRYGENLDIL